jgi:hypothetical protein
LKQINRGLRVVARDWMSVHQLERVTAHAAARPPIIVRADKPAGPGPDGSPAIERSPAGDRALIERLRRLAQPVVAKPEFLRTVLDTLPEHVAVLDRTGTIVTVNRAWMRFADDNGLRTPNYAVGANYLAIARDASGVGSEGAGEVARALEDLCAGRRDTFHL